MGGTVLRSNGLLIANSTFEEPNSSKLIKSALATPNSVSIKVVAVATFVFLAYGLSYILSCDLDKNREWTCGNYSLAISRIATLNVFLK